MQQETNRRAYLQLHTAVFLFGFTGVLGELIQLDATLLVWYRMAMTVLLMFAYVRWIGQWKWLSRKEILHITGVSSAIVVHWILFYGSIKYASVSVAMICLSSITLFTAFLEPLLLKRPFSLWEGLFSLVVIAGVYLMAEDQQQHSFGIAIGLASAFFSALFTVLNKRLVGRYDSRLLSLYELSTGFILLSCALPFLLQWLPSVSHFPSSSDWFYLFLLSFFCTVVAFNLSLNSLRFLSPFTVNLAINLEPVYGIALAFLIFAEYRELGWGFYAGAALILLALLGEILYKRFSQKA